MADKGMLVHALRNALGDCTNRGVTSQFASFVLIGQGGDFEPSSRTPALFLGLWRDRLIALPEPPQIDKWGRVEHLGPWMNGGNWVHTSDSRYPFEGPIPVYDRREF